MLVSIAIISVTALIPWALSTNPWGMVIALAFVAIPSNVGGFCDMRRRNRMKHYHKLNDTTSEAYNQVSLKGVQDKQNRIDVLLKKLDGIQYHPDFELSPTDCAKNRRKKRSDLDRRAKLLRQDIKSYDKKVQALLTKKTLYDEDNRDIYRLPDTIQDNQALTNINKLIKSLNKEKDLDIYVLEQDNEQEKSATGTERVYSKLAEIDQEGMDKFCSKFTFEGGYQPETPVQKYFRDVAVKLMDKQGEDIYDSVQEVAVGLSVCENSDVSYAVLEKFVKRTMANDPNKITEFLHGLKGYASEDSVYRPWDKIPNTKILSKSCYTATHIDELEMVEFLDKKLEIVTNQKDIGEDAIAIKKLADTIDAKLLRLTDSVDRFEKKMEKINQKKNETEKQRTETNDKEITHDEKSATSQTSAEEVEEAKAKLKKDLTEEQLRIYNIDELWQKYFEITTKVKGKHGQWYDAESSASQNVAKHIKKHIKFQEEKRLAALKKQQKRDAKAAKKEQKRR